jgi:hypothetical protein
MPLRHIWRKGFLFASDLKEKDVWTYVTFALNAIGKIIGWQKVLRKP